MDRRPAGIGADRPTFLVRQGEHGRIARLDNLLVRRIGAKAAL
jgi:hypothetical protein